MNDSDDEGKAPRDERELFEQAMRDVEPLADGAAAALPAPRRPPVRPGPRLSGQRRDARFELEVSGERLRGRVPGFDLRQLRRLERGEVPPELSLDLHGFTQLEARGAVRDALRRAQRSGLRSVRVIHGRGLGSETAPVLKEALPGWLAEPPLGGWVLAFASAPPALGGTGATLILLRPSKPRKRGRA